MLFHRDKPMFGLFILHNGEWKLNSLWNKLSEAKQEQDYLVNMLGVTTQVFVRK